MTMLAVHEEALSATVVPLHNFMNRYNSASKIVYGFVEGKEDPSFYRGVIEHSLPEDWNVELWTAGNKDKVIDLYSLFDWDRFPKLRLVFFIDRDLDNFLGYSHPVEVNFFVTDKYSIENEIVNRGTCNRVLTEICNLQSLNREDIDMLLDLFLEQLVIFRSHLGPVMSWLIHWRRLGKKPSAQDIQMDHMFKFSAGSIIPKLPPKKGADYIEYIHLQCGIRYEQNVDISPIIDEFTRGNGLENFIRGKYELWFLVKFALSVHKDLPSLVGGIRVVPRMKGSLGPANAMVVVGPLARCPGRLRDFISNTVVEYANTFEA